MNMDQDDLNLKGMPDTKGSVLAHLLLKPMKFVPEPTPSIIPGVFKVLAGMFVAGMFAVKSLDYVDSWWINFALPGVGFLFYLAILAPNEDEPGAGNERLTIRDKGPAQEDPEPDLSLRPTGDWDSIVDALIASPNPIERDHFFRGWIHGTHYPLLVSPDTWGGHIAVFGTTRSGKTSVGMLPLIVQAIRRRKSVITQIDMKGDEYARETLRLEAERAGLPFKDFALETGKASHLFNPFLQEDWRVLSINEKTQLFLSCLGLAHHDDDTGTVYFESCSNVIVQAALQLHPIIRSPREMNAIVTSKQFRQQSGIGRRDFENAGALFNYLRILAEPWQLNAVPGDGYPDAVFRDAIYLDKCRAQPCVTYWRLPAALEPKTNQFIGRVVVLLHCTAARMSGPSGYQHHIGIDEYQVIVQSALTGPIKQAADRRISFFLAMQSMSDLIKPAINALDAVIENTSMRDYFTAQGPLTRDYLSRVSGQEFVPLESKGCTDHLEGPANGNADAWTKSYTTSESQREMR